MPTITELNLIDITPRAFLDNCSPDELLEVAGLLQRQEYLDKMLEARHWRVGFWLMLEETNYYNESCDSFVTNQLLTALTHE